MTLGQRIEERRIERKIPSISRLARLADVPQSTMSGLINGPSRWSPHLPKLAKVLGTTVEYLLGTTDDPDENTPSPPPKPEFRTVTLDVALPSEAALEQMFAGLLAVCRGMTWGEIAHELAVHLPTGLELARSGIPSNRPYRPLPHEAEIAVARDDDRPAARSSRT